MIKTYISVLKADVKNILRDGSLILMLIVPFILVPIIRYGGSAIINYFPISGEYVKMCVILLGATVAVFPAFVLGFVMMDEKDGGINQVLRVLPFSLNKLIGLRLGIMVFLGLFNSLFFFAFNGHVALGFVQMVVLSINSSLFAPITAFLMLCISANKIEAAAVLKGISFVTFFAFLQFFIPNGYKYFLSAIPAFWVYRAFELRNDVLFFTIFNFTGITIQLVYLAILWRIFLRKW